MVGRSAELGPGSELGRGGMRSKVLAAQMSSAAGIPTVIAAGHGEEVLGPILAGEAPRRGSRPTSTASPRSSCGSASASRSPGDCTWTRGRAGALVETGASLLGVGVERCEGRFDAGAAVELVGPDGVAFAKGIAGAGADELKGRPRGLRPSTATSWCSTEEGRLAESRVRDREVEQRFLRLCVQMIPGRAGGVRAREGEGIDAARDVVRVDMPLYQYDDQVSAEPPAVAS